MIATEAGSAIKEDKIIGEARKISKPKIIIKTGKHKAQQITLWKNAYCIIEKKMRFIK